MNKLLGIASVFYVVSAVSLTGCEKTPQQESKTDSMKESVSSSADQIKESANDAADKMKESSEQIKDSASQYIDDATITAKVKEKLVAEPVTKAYQISVETLNGTVQLSGFVESSEAKDKAGEIAGAVSGVKSVKNDLILKSKT